MENHLNIQKCLRAFAAIVADGERREEDSAHWLDGVMAKSLDDGYTIVLKNHDSQLTIYFHNKFALDSPDAHRKEAFIKQLYRIAEH